ENCILVYGVKTKPVFHKKAKTTQKIVLKLQCLSCKYYSQHAIKILLSRLYYVPSSFATAWMLINALLFLGQKGTEKGVRTEGREIYKIQNPSMLTYV
ncbi:hypothetical protein EJB05_02019, partial [Eragrostis curvula]